MADIDMEAQKKRLERIITHLHKQQQTDKETDGYTKGVNEVKLRQERPSIIRDMTDFDKFYYLDCERRKVQ
jgi:hypothetical protein